MKAATPSAAHLRKGAARVVLVTQVRAHLAAGLQWKEIGALLKTNWQSLRRWHLSVARIPTVELTAADLAPRWRFSGRKPKPAQP